MASDLSGCSGDVERAAEVEHRLPRDARQHTVNGGPEMAVLDDEDVETRTFSDVVIGIDDQRRLRAMVISIEQALHKVEPVVVLDGRVDPAPWARTSRGPRDRASEFANVWVLTKTSKASMPCCAGCRHPQDRRARYSRLELVCAAAPAFAIGRAVGHARGRPPSSEGLLASYVGPSRLGPAAPTPGTA